MTYNKQDVSSICTYTELAVKTGALSEEAHKGIINLLTTSLEDEKYNSIKQVSQRLNVSRMTVIRMIKRGELESIKIGSSVRIPESSITALIESGRK